MKCWYCQNDYHEDCNGFANETLDVIIRCECEEGTPVEHNYTETEMDAIREKWFMSGYKAGKKDGIEEALQPGYREWIADGWLQDDFEEKGALYRIKETRNLPTGDGRNSNNDVTDKIKLCRCGDFAGPNGTCNWGDNGCYNCPA